ncbi:MAG: oligosaccharide flippase family protein [Verrucomicrobiae bacterium]|nr:oligosaccharide flippase family protein [Verrucomicrobiae bacterium]
MSTARKAGHAAGALFLRKVWTSLVSLGVIGYLARTLDIEAFGVVAVCATLLSLIQVLAVSGISEYVVFYNGDEDEKRTVANAAFWLNFFASLLVVAVGIGVAPLIVEQNDPIYGPVIMVMLASFFSSMVASIPKALYRKEINYGPLVALETVQQTLISIGQVVLAWRGFGVLSLVLPTAIVGPIIAAIFMWKSPLVLTGSLGILHWGKILRYTRHIIGARLLTRLANEGDNLVIKTVLGDKALGLYALAYRMANILFLSLMPVVVDVSMPVFARIASNTRRLFLGYVKMLSLIAFVMFPVLLLLFVSAPEIAQVVYGNKAIDQHQVKIGILAQIMMVSVLGRCISSPTGGLFNATGKPHIPMWFASVFTPLFLGTLYVTSGYGLYVAAFTVAAFFTVGQVVQTWLASRLIFHYSLSRVLYRIWPYAFPAGMAAGIALAARVFIYVQNPIAHIVAVSLVFAVSYAILFRVLSPKEVERIGRLLQSIHPRLGQAARWMTWPELRKATSHS